MNKKHFALILIVVIAALCSTLPALADSICDPSVNYNSLGSTAYEQGDYQAAIDSFTCAVQLHPDAATAYNARGNAYRNLGSYELAIADYSKAIEIDKEYAIAYNNRGWAYFKLDDRDKALEDYNKALEIDPNLSYAHNNRGLIYQLRGQADLANTDFTQAIALNLPTNWADYNLSLLRLEAASKAAVTGAVPVSAPESPEVAGLLDQAQAAYDGRDFAGAVEFFTAALEITPDDIYAHYLRGRSYIALDMFPEALADFNRMVELAPDFVYGYWERAIAYAEVGDFEHAKADADHAYQLDPVHVNNFIARGTIAALSGDPVEAGRQFSYLLDAYDTEPVTGTTIQPGETVTIVMENHKIYAVTFEGKANQVLHLGAHSTQADPIIVLLDVNGSPMNGDDDSGTGLDALICNCRLPEDGTYTLLVSHAGGGSDGPIEVKIEMAVSN